MANPFVLQSILVHPLGIEHPPSVTVDAVDAVSSSIGARHHVVQISPRSVYLCAGVGTVLQLLPIAQTRGGSVRQVHIRLVRLVYLRLVGEQDLWLGAEVKMDIEKEKGRGKKKDAGSYKDAMLIYYSYKLELLPRQGLAIFQKYDILKTFF